MVKRHIGKRQEYLWVGIIGEIAHLSQEDPLPVPLLLRLKPLHRHIRLKCPDKPMQQPPREGPFTLLRLHILKVGVAICSVCNVCTQAAESTRQLPNV